MTLFLVSLAPTVQRYKKNIYKRRHEIVQVLGGIYHEESVLRIFDSSLGILDPILGRVQ